MVFDLLEKHDKVYTLGPIIHNRQMAEELSEKGAVIAEGLDAVDSDGVLVIRSHGVPESVYSEIKKLGLSYEDATCPFVSKIHKIVKQQSNDGNIILIAGDENHPEVIGIRGYISTQSFCFKSVAELEDIFRKNENISDLSLCIAAQTTFSQKEWEKCVKIVKKLCTNAKVFDTICNATVKRQEEAERLSLECDLMVIVGSHESSNTQKLRDVCAANTRTVLIECADELSKDIFLTALAVGVTAGASTPAHIIKEVLVKMSDILNTSEEKIMTENQDEVMENVSESIPETVSEKEETAVPEQTADEAAPIDEPASAEQTESVQAETQETMAVEEAKAVKAFEDMTFEEMIDVYSPTANTDSRIMGVIVGIAPNEIQVDVGRKQAGYIPIAELSSDPNAVPEDIVKIGDEIELLIMKTNDVEGTIMLSKKRVDALKGWDTVVAASEDSEVILDGIVTEVINGGVLAVTNGVRVFIPASLSTMSRDDDLNDLLRTEVRFKILEVNRSRRRAVGSIKAVLREERKAMNAEIWNKIEVGSVFTGVVKSMTTYGAFVDIGGVDGMIHVSELAWTRIKHPQDVLAIGDTVEVYVKAVDEEKHKISLGYKKSEDNPWEILKKDYAVDQTVNVKIVQITAFGAFANIMPGIDGLIHISQISHERIARAADVLKIGQETEAKIVGIDFERRRVNLSIKALLEPPVIEEMTAEEEASEVIEEAAAPVVEEAVAEEVAPVEEDTPVVEEVQAEEVAPTEE